MTRGGKTTRQMLYAPRGALFVWATSALMYPVALAQHLGREDLIIKPKAWLRIETALGLPRDVKVVIDHGLPLDRDFYTREAVGLLRSRGMLS